MYQNEFSQEFEQAFGQEMEMEQEFNGENFEFSPEYLGETSAQGESFETYGELSGELNETFEMELAHELLEVSNEMELNQFLGSLVKKVGGAVSGFAKSSIGKTIGGALKAVAKKALPMVSGALGTFVGGPLGTALGSKLGSMAGNLFELELEGLSPEDQEFETARAFVRFANSAVQRGAAAAQSPRRNVPPAVAARKALTSAAMQHAPGLLRPRNANGTFRSMQGAGARRPSYGPRRQPAFRGSNGYLGGSYEPTQAAGGEGYPDQGDEQQDYGQPSQQHRPTRGTWMRRGRTLVIQL
jgi:uncharacterized protein (DUF697 family)